jgi:uncharacterized protein YqgC (DUF456 family)
MNQNKPLWQEILAFSKHKYKIGVILIIIGIPGLILPVIPGIFLIGLGIFFLKPEWYAKLKDMFTRKSPDR